MTHSSCGVYISNSSTYLTLTSLKCKIDSFHYFDLISILWICSICILEWIGQLTLTLSQAIHFLLTLIEHPSSPPFIVGFVLLTIIEHPSSPLFIVGFVMLTLIEHPSSPPFIVGFVMLTFIEHPSSPPFIVAFVLINLYYYV